jgi:hypothetical protein
MGRIRPKRNRDKRMGMFDGKGPWMELRYGGKG